MHNKFSMISSSGAWVYHPWKSLSGRMLRELLFISIWVLQQVRQTLGQVQSGLPSARDHCRDATLLMLVPVVFVSFAFDNHDEVR